MPFCSSHRHAAVPIEYFQLKLFPLDHTPVYFFLTTMETSVYNFLTGTISVWNFSGYLGIFSDMMKLVLLRGVLEKEKKPSADCISGMLSLIDMRKLLNAIWTKKMPV